MGTQSFLSRVASALILITGLGLNAGLGWADPILDTDLPEAKRTPQNLYLTSDLAYRELLADPEILFIDVRDPVEISRMGFPEPIDAIIPIQIHGARFIPELEEFELVENTDFLDEFRALMAARGLQTSHRIIVTCGSGRRSAMAARVLAGAGFTNVWHIVDGYAGDERPGTNLQNAWRLAELPWVQGSPVAGDAWRRSLE